MSVALFSIVTSRGETGNNSKALLATVGIFVVLGSIVGLGYLVGNYVISAPNLFFGIGAIILGIVAWLLVMNGLWRIRLFFWEEPIPTRGYDRVYYSEPTPLTTENMDMIRIDGYPHRVRACCYQTARLNEGYCVCGRAVDPDLAGLVTL